MTVRIKRDREPKAKADGFRILVDGMWPRGVKKEELGVDLWLKDVAPSRDLRTWFGHDPEKFDEFASRYRRELEGSDALEELREAVREHGTVTLLFDAKDEEHNQAVVLRDLLGD